MACACSWLWDSDIFALVLIMTFHFWRIPRRRGRPWLLYFSFTHTTDDES
jgi:hypothetical protein